MKKDEFKYFHLSDKLSARCVMKRDYPTHKWPISGGWGYSRDTATVLEVDNEPDGIDMEEIFLQYRTYEELIVRRSRDDMYSGIRFKKLKQSLIPTGDKYYDFVEYEISCFSDEDWFELKRDYESHNGYRSDEEGLMAHIRRREEKIIRFTTGCWYDITRFYPRADAPQKMSLDEYKKRVEAALRKRYPNITEREIEKSMTMSESAWLSYMEDFSPEILPEAWAAGA